MPYINPDRADYLSDKIYELSRNIHNLGELNYVITKLLLSEAPAIYSDFAALIGTLECAQLEFYRRAVAPYEDKKRAENGDVYE